MLSQKPVFLTFSKWRISVNNASRSLKFTGFIPCHVFSRSCKFARNKPFSSEDTALWVWPLNWWKKKRYIYVLNVIYTFFLFVNVTVTSGLLTDLKFAAFVFQHVLTKSWKFGWDRMFPSEENRLSNQPPLPLPYLLEKTMYFIHIFDVFIPSYFYCNFSSTKELETRRICSSTSP